ncbi:hypothetical protein H9P43_000898 [Blastocladiella emersonii ATCC 22665]|nr:hypothetical protein H9P43_000898 [Blastocladiella emersonii ATCC 22665]
MVFCSPSAGGTAVLDPRVLDFTPCFQQAVLLNVPTAVMLLLGGPRLFFLANRKSRFPPSNRLYLELLLLLGAVVLAVITVVASDEDMDASVLVAQIGSVVALLSASPIVWLEHTKLPAPSSLISVFWLLRTIAGGLALRTYVRLGTVTTSPTYFYLFLASTLVSLAATLVGAVPTCARRDALNTSPEHTASVFSRITFSWLFPLLRTANRKTITIDDVYETPRFLATGRLEPLYQELAATAESKTAINQLTFGVVARFWTTFALVMLGNAAYLVFNFATPAFLNGLIGFVEASAPSSVATPPIGDGLIFAIGLFLSTNFSTISNNYALQLVTKLQLRMRTVLMTAIYRKALVLSLGERGKSSVGEIVTRMSVDTGHVVAFLVQVNEVWMVPITAALSLNFLWDLLGPAALSGLLVMAVISPIVRWSTGIYMRENKIKLDTMDIRIKLVNEVIAGIKTVRLYGLEEYFTAKLIALRDTEQAALRRRWKAFSFVVGVNNSSQIMIILVTFGFASLLAADKPLTPQRVFVSLSYLNLFLNTLGSIFNMIGTGGTALVSYRRIGQFLDAQEIDAAAVDRSTDASGPVAIRICDGRFQWATAADDDADETAPAATFELKGINFTLGRGKLTAVIGRVAEGKSALLHAILGEMRKLDGSVTVRGSIAYVPQSAWIFNGTLRENIVHCSPYDEAWYHRVVEACALVPDVRAMANGHDTLIGDRGVTCSGGQQARISLARAVYANRDIYLIDSALAAVDSMVSTHIFTHVFGPRGLLRGKSIVFVTHGVHHLAQCDEVVLLKDGAIVESGSFDDLMDRRGDVYALVTEFSAVDRSSPSGDAADPALSTADSALTIAEPEQVDDKCTLSPPATAQQQDDDSLTGTVTFAVYAAYLRACGTYGLALFIPAFLIGNGITSLHSYWLNVMSTAVNAATPDRPVDLGYYLGVYGGLTALNVVAMWLVAHASLTVMSVTASRVLHANLIARVMRAPLSWFTVVPAGRIVNRFSSDQTDLDEAIPFSLLNFVFMAGTVIVAIVLVGISAPVVLALVPFAGAYLYFLARYYLTASRELKRIDSSTIAPIYHKFEESIHGLVSIRAYAVHAEYAAQMADAFDRNNRARYLSVSLSRWLSVHSSALASLFILGVGLAAVATRGSIAAAMVGLAISQAQELVWAFRKMVTATCDLENEMVAVERVLQYSSVDQEAPAKTNVVLPANWPTAGAVEFRNFSATYRPELPPVLRDINVSIAPGSRVGIVGRTGSGKTSLTLALFRIIEATRGSISIDGLDLSTLGLADLRSHLCIIPQDPQLFAGPLRANLDPLGAHDDAAVWRALELAHMRDRVAGLDGKLHAAVATGGSDFSSGERQLLSLAAAILRKRRVVIFDEASGSLDAETDAVIQKTIREEFDGCTVLTIAHRIGTIIDYDKILVLDHGEVAEFDTPAALLEKADGLFAKLVADSQSRFA